MLKNGDIFHEQKLIAKHPKATGKHQCVIEKEHFKGIITAGRHQVPQPRPKLVSDPIPEVLQRDLRIYEQFLDEAVTMS